MRLPAAATLSILVTVGATSAERQPAPATGKKYVSIVASVLDRDGTVVPNLQKEDFAVLDEGKPQEIVYFQNNPRPFTVVVLLDLSRSMSTKRPAVMIAAEQFIGGLLPEDAGRVGAFSEGIHIGH